MKKLPFYLIISRLFIGLAICLSAMLQPSHYQLWIVVLMIFGLLTDVFDGILARALKVSTEKLRVWDSNVDQIFWLATIASIFTLNWNFVWTHIGWIAAVFALELACYVTSYIKFRKSVATHSILAKVWILSLLAFLIDLCLNGTSGFWFILCMILGIVSRYEILMIIQSLKTWTTDVPGIRAAIRINKGLKVKKSKLFNS